MMNIGKKVKKILIGVGIFAFLYTSSLCINYLVFDREFKMENSHYITKIDGVGSSTTCERFRDGHYDRDGVKQHRFLSSSRFIDDGWIYGKRDGLVDMIHKFSFRDGFSLLIDGKLPKGTILYRDKDFDENKDEFLAADKLLQQTKERFKGYF